MHNPFYLLSFFIKSYACIWATGLLLTLKGPQSKNMIYYTSLKVQIFFKLIVVASQFNT